ncbi:MAG: FAD-dependent oxidoreductase, partial [Sphingomonadales bacterium]|nr:FAD-dependent oxidoreductase [Sphingomonadales bacterium]
MKLTLPPGLSPQGFDAAVKALQGAVGAGWVMTTDEDRDAYADIYAPGPETLWSASGAVAPQTVEEVQAVVRIVNEHKLPLWTVGRGKNLGYGTAAPRMPGSMVLDLGRMDKILELDATLGYCVIEPGVGFLDLYERIQ